MSSCDSETCKSDKGEKCYVEMVSNGSFHEGYFEEMGIDADGDDPPVCFTLCKGCIDEKGIPMRGVCCRCDTTMIDDGFCLNDKEGEIYCRECVNDDTVRSAVDMYYPKERGNFSFITWFDLSEEGLTDTQKEIVKKALKRYLYDDFEDSDEEESGSESESGEKKRKRDGEGEEVAVEGKASAKKSK